MRNFFLFVQRYYHVFLFFILEIFSFYAIYQFHNYHHAVMLNTANSVNGRIIEANANIVKYFSLDKENARLQLENNELRKKVRESFYVQHSDSVVNSDTSYSQKFTYIPGEVVRNSTDLSNNYIIIDRGTMHGVTKDMGVICPDGIVGIVVNASEKFCIAMSVLNSKFKVTPKLMGNTSIGRLIWTGNSPYMASIEGINKYNLVKKGEMVYTSPYSTLFPENVKIGKIIESKPIEGSNLLKITIKLSTNFTNLRSVYIVNNLQIKEIQNLEESLNLDN